MAGEQGDLAAELEAARDGAGLWERADWGRRRLTGEDRLTFLHKYCTQAVKDLAPGQGAYACCLTVKGTMVGDLWVFAREEDALVLVPPAASEGLFAHLETYALFDEVTIEDLAPSRGVLSLWGAQAGAVLEQVLGAAPPAEALASTTLTWRDREVVVARDDLPPGPGWVLFVPADAREELSAALVGAGARPVGPAAVDALRIEAGRPLFGVDMDGKTIPLEAGLEERAISFSKGCYIGQETIARATHRGRVNRHLVGYRLPGDAPLAAPTDVFFEGKRVGAVTSSARVPRLGGVVGLGLCHRKAAAPGTEVRLGDPEGQPAEVRPLPFEP